jgi:hypothetical protein
VGARAASILPFVIAVLLPPAGLLIGLLQLTQPDRERGVRLIVVAVLAGALWAFLLFG